MIASAKSVEKVLKSFLVVVLAVSFCPLIPAEKAQAQEAGDSNELAASVQVADEDGAKSADSGSENPASTVEGDPADSDGVALQASESGTPIVDWTECGTCRWMIDATGCLIIEPQSGEFGRLDDFSKSPWSKYRNNVISAKVRKRVSLESASHMFADCSSLESVDLSGLDTSEVTGMPKIFEGCSSLQSLDISGWDISKVTRMESMFSGCSSLTSLKLPEKLPDGKASAGANTSFMFFNCSLLKNVSIANHGTFKVTNAWGMFDGCSSLMSLDISALDTSNATNMSGMFEGCSSLQSLDVSRLDTSRVTDMSGMFEGCSSLASLDLSNFNTANVANMSCMFYDCAFLKSLDLSKLDTSKVTRMNHMFYGCSSLRKVDFGMIDTSKVGSMSGMFDGCSSIESLDLSKLDTSKVVDMSSMFSGCSSLGSLNLSGFDTSNVTNMWCMFQSCGVPRLDLSGFDTSNVTDTSFMFNSAKVQNLDLSSFNTSNVTKMANMFGYTYSLREVSLGDKFTFNGRGASRMCSLPTPSGDGLTGRWVSSADDMAYAPDSIPSNKSATYTAQTTESFEGWNQTGGCVWRVDDEGCLTIKPLSGSETGRLGEWLGDNAPWKSQTSAIKSAVIEKGVIAGQCLDCMFNGCSNLVSADLSGISTSNTTSMVAMFRDCTSLESLNVSSFDTSKVTSMFAMFNSCLSLKSLDLSSFDTSSVTSMWVMFGNCSSLKSLTLSSRFDTSSVEKMDMMFAGCTALTALDVSGFDTSNVKTMRYMFSNCKSLTSLDVTGFNTSEVVEDPDPQYPSAGMDGMFNGCSSLTSLDVSGFDTSKVTNLSKMFNGCSSLVSLDLSSLDTSNVMDMSNMFQGCGKLESIDLRNLNTSSTTNFSGMFAACKSLPSLNLSSFSTSKATDMGGMFNSCEKLESLDLSNFDTSQVTDMSFMFEGCSALKSLDLSKLSTSTTKKMASMFSGCSSVDSLNLGNFSTAVVSDMSNMFDGCTSLASLDISHFDTSSASNMGNMFWNCGSLRFVALGDKFSFSGSKEARQCALPKLKGDGLTGLWENAETHEAYAEDEIPNNVAATYTAQAKGEAPKAAIDESMFTVDTAAKIYTGSPIEPSVSSATLRRGTDYTVAYGENVNAGEGTVVITGTGSYTGQVTYTFRIDPKRVAAPEAATGLVYSGAEQVGVAPSGEYEVSGGSATNAGGYTATASLKDRRNFVWSASSSSDDIEVAWAIAKASPSYSAPAPVDATLGQTLGDIAPSLPAGFSWRDDPSTGVGDAGEHEFAATFTPEDTTNYKVVENIAVTVRVSINLVAVPRIADLVYTGEFQKAAVPESDFYAMEEIRGGTEAGTYEAKLSLKDPSSCRWADDGSNSEKTVTYRILPAQLTDVMITGVPVRMEATGSQLAPEPIVTFNGKTLVQGADFVLSYGENVNPGKGSVTVSAVEGGNFKGSVTVEFDIEKKAVPAPVFSDVDYSDSSWYGDAVTFVASRGLVTGYTDGVKAGQFGVGDPLTRAQLATILWRNACPDEYASYDPETAVDTTGIAGSADGTYYTAAANWAVKNGVITGFEQPDGTFDFAADKDVSFDQLITILSRLCATDDELAAAGSDLSSFADGDLASSWSRGAFAWAADKGLVQGYDEPAGKYLRPGEDVARERVAVVLMRAFEMGVLK